MKLWQSRYVEVLRDPRSQVEAVAAEAVIFAFGGSRMEHDRGGVLM
ncbi:MAG: hypothetical protein ABJC12_07650 [Saprospiraceae bacterium]